MPEVAEKEIQMNMIGPRDLSALAHGVPLVFRVLDGFQPEDYAKALKESVLRSGLIAPSLPVSAWIFYEKRPRLDRRGIWKEAGWQVKVVVGYYFDEKGKLTIKSPQLAMAVPPTEVLQERIQQAFEFQEAAKLQAGSGA